MVDRIEALCSTCCRIESPCFSRINRRHAYQGSVPIAMYWWRTETNLLKEHPVCCVSPRQLTMAPTRSLRSLTFACLLTLLPFSTYAMEGGLRKILQVSAPRVFLARLTWFLAGSTVSIYPVLLLGRWCANLELKMMVIVMLSWIAFVYEQHRFVAAFLGPDMIDVLERLICVHLTDLAGMFGQAVI